MQDVQEPQEPLQGRPAGQTEPEPLPEVGQKRAPQPEPLEEEPRKRKRTARGVPKPPLPAKTKKPPADKRVAKQKKNS